MSRHSHFIIGVSIGVGIQPTALCVIEQIIGGVVSLLFKQELVHRVKLALSLGSDSSARSWPRVGMTAQRKMFVVDPDVVRKHLRHLG